MMHKAGDKCLVNNLDYIDMDDYPEEMADIVLDQTLIYTGRKKERSMYGHEDDNGDWIIGMAYLFTYYFDEEEYEIYLFEENFTWVVQKKDPPKTELEWLDRVQQNFRE